MLAPIVLFAYNRPLHMQQTLDALVKNEEAKNSLLIIYCDGVKKEAKSDQIEKIEQVRLIARNENRFQSVTVIEQTANKGLANSIIDGVTEVVNKYGKIIVLEDDLVTSPLFLKFMNNALNYYSEKNQVACVTGYVFPLKNVNNNEAFFIKGADCWSWATWKNKWNDVFCGDAALLISDLNKKKLKKEFDFNNTHPYFKMLLNKQKGKNDSWAILWYASAFLKNQFCLYPPKSLVFNIGTDGSGSNFKQIDNNYLVDLETQNVPLFPKVVVELNENRKKFEFFFKSLNISFLKLVRLKFINLLKIK